MFSPLVQRLIDNLRCLPGVGPKTAQRMALELLERKRDSGLALSEALQQAIQYVGRCQQCRNLSETAVCGLCSNTRRDSHLLCVVESPADVMAFEYTACYSGHYFVLAGHLSPIDGIGPEELGLQQLVTRCKQGVEEIILATSATVEGEATAHYIGQLLHHLPIRISRIAHGIPIGGEVEYLDSNTLQHALRARSALK